MSKKKITPQQAAKTLMQPAIYYLNFKDVPVDKYMPALKEVFYNPNFVAIAEKRNALGKSAERLRLGSSELQNITQAIIQRDRKLADMVFSALMQANLNADESYDFLSFPTLLKYYVDYSREGMKNKVTALSANLDKMTFCADFLESVLIDIKADMREIFNDRVEFQQFDAVAHVLTQLRGFFNSVRSKTFDSEEGKLYVDYSDSINAYLDKRIKTYTQKYRKLHPAVPVYTEEEMLEALNSFFGTKMYFGEKFIKHTDTGGEYIDAVALAFNLNEEQTKKLDKAVVNSDKKTASDDTLRYCFDVTDAIMREYFAHINK